MKHTLPATLFALGCFALANQVLAQTAAPANPRDERRVERVQRMCQNLDTRLDGRLSFLQSRLKITDAQKPAFNGYASALRATLDPLRQDCAAGRVGQRATTLPRQLEAMQRLADQRVASLRSIKPAAESLYAALTPDQQKTADRILMSPRSRG